MGLFGNYDKPGKGIEKDAPKKRGIFLYAELFWRKLGLLVKSNILYFVVSIPVLVLYHFLCWFALCILKTDGAPSVRTLILSTILLAVFWGTGPVSCGYTYLLRNFAREEHVFLMSDFFEKIKENFKAGLLVLVADSAVILLGSTALAFYTRLLKSGYGFAKYIICALLVMAMLYTFMHYYIYELTVTFENKFMTTVRNSFILASATIPMNLVLSVITAFITLFLFGYLTPLAMVFATLFFWFGFMRFPIDFYSARLIKRKLIDIRSDVL